MEPLIISNRYHQSAEHFAKLYGATLVRQRIYLFILLPGVSFLQIVTSLIGGKSAEPGLVSLSIFILIFFLIRYRFLQSIKKNPAFKHSRFFTLYPDQLIIEAENGSRSVIDLADIRMVKSLKDDYQFQLKTKAQFWIPKDALKNDGDVIEFERVLRVVS